MIVIGASLLLSACGKTETSTTKETNQITRPEPTAMATKVPEKYNKWEDEAGFSFEYPEDVKVTANTADNSSYANLTTSDGVKIMAIDSKYKDVATWVKTDTSFKDGVIVDSKLGGKDGKKIIKNGVVTVGIIDDSILFTVVIPSSGLSGDKILESFKLVYPVDKEVAKQVLGTTGEGDVIEEEEIVE